MMKNVPTKIIAGVEVVDIQEMEKQQKLEDFKKLVHSINYWSERIVKFQDSVVDDLLAISRDLIKAEKREDEETVIRHKEMMFDTASFGHKKILKYRETLGNKMKEFCQMEIPEGLDEQTEYEARRIAKNCDLSQ